MAGGQQADTTAEMTVEAAAAPAEAAEQATDAVITEANGTELPGPPAPPAPGEQSRCRSS